jgi:hypothetical protein
MQTNKNVDILQAAEIKTLQIIMQIERKIDIPNWIPRKSTIAGPCNDNELWNQWLGDPAFPSFVSALFDISTNQPMAFASKLSSSNNVLAFGNQALSLWLYMEIAQCRIVEWISVEN